MSTTRKPKDLDEALDLLSTILSDDEFIFLKSRNQDNLYMEFHNNIGYLIRNSWCLSNYEITKWFKSYGINDSDDMSMIIIRSYWRRINSKPIKFKEQVDQILELEKLLSEFAKAFNDQS